MEGGPGIAEDFAGDGCLGSCLACIGSLLDGGDRTRQVGSDRLSVALGTASFMCGQAGRRKCGRRRACTDGSGDEC
jgi:hypothetical protein